MTFSDPKEVVYSPALGGRTPLEGPTKMESPKMLTAAFMLVKGNMSQKDVAAALDVTPQTVSNWVRSSVFQERCTAIAKAAGMDAVEAVMKGEAMACFSNLIELRDSSETPKHTKVDIDKYILDRVFGKPTQKVEQKLEVTSDDPVAEAERLEAENRRLLGLTSPN